MKKKTQYMNNSKKETNLDLFIILRNGQKCDNQQRLNNDFEISEWEKNK